MLTYGHMTTLTYDHVAAMLTYDHMATLMSPAQLP